MPGVWTNLIVGPLCVGWGKEGVGVGGGWGCGGDGRRRRRRRREVWRDLVNDFCHCRFLILYLHFCLHVVKTVKLVT